MKSTRFHPWALALPLILSACPGGSSGGANGVTWSRSFGGPAWDEAAGAIPTADGGYLFAGTSGALYDTRDPYDDEQVDGEVWVVKLNALGNPEWERTYGERFLSPVGNRITYERAAAASGGETWIAGVESISDAPTGDPLADGGNLVVARLDAAGTLLWRHTYDSGAFLGHPFTSSLETAHESVRDVVATADGGLLVACWVSARVDKPLQMRRGVEVNALWVVKLDDDGDVLWDRHLVRAADGVEYERFFPYHAGATIHVGIYDSHDGGGLVTAYSSAEPDTVIARLQSNGTLRWSRTRVDGHVRDVAPIDANADGTADDGFVLAGIDDPHGGDGGFLVRLDRDGNPVWGEDDGDVDRFECVTQGEYIDSNGLQVPAIAAAGIRGSGSLSQGRILFVSLDGSDRAAFDPYVVDDAPEIRFDIDRWRVLGVSQGLAFVSSFSRFRNLIDTAVLDRVPDRNTVELSPDGSLLDLTRPRGAGGVVLTRMTPAGTIALERTFPSGGRFAERAHAVVELSGPGARYAVLAETGSFGSGLDELWLLLLDEDGDVLRQRVFEDFFLVRPHATGRVGALTATRDGGLVFAALAGGGTRLVRVDAAGEALWNSELLGPSEALPFLAFPGETGETAVETADGGFVVVGSLLSGGGWAARLDAEGDVVWRRRYESPNERQLELTAVLETANGFTLAGLYDSELFAMQVDGAGGVQRAHFFARGGAPAGPVVRMAPAEQGGVLLGTSWVDANEPVGDLEDGAASTGRINMLLLRLDAGLEASWYRIYGALYDEHLAGLAAVEEGGWLVSGRSDSLGDLGEGWLLRVDYQGLISEGCNAYLEGGAWPLPAVATPISATAALPDVDAQQLAPILLSIVDTPAPTQFPPASVVARQCLGTGPLAPPEDPYEPPGDGEMVTLTVVFAGGGQGTVQSSPPALDCRATCQAEFPAGVRVLLTPLVDEGFFFSHWEGCDEDLGIEGCFVNLTSDRTVTVYFE